MEPAAKILVVDNNDQNLTLIRVILRRHGYESRLALALLAATAALNRDNRVQPLAMHLGLNSALALVGSTRFEALCGSRWTFTASGPVTNRAARLRARLSATCSGTSAGAR